MSLPLAFKTTLDTVPADVPYLKAPPDRLQKWSHLSSRQGFRVALAWAGSATHKQDQLRSIPLNELVPMIAGADGVEWLSVQRELRAGDAELLGKLPNVRSTGEDLEDFADTAAVLAHADLVITVDTAVAHLAGALGRPVWLLAQYSPDFRWLLDREDSPWYPTLRIFRQDELRDWSGVVRRVAEALKSSVRVADIR